MTFIEPLAMETWIVSVFSGTTEIFTAIGFLVIMSMAGYFRMRGMGLFFMIGIFILMFAEIIPFSIYVLVGIFGGLAIGYTLANIFQR